MSTIGQAHSVHRRMTQNSAVVLGTCKSLVSTLLLFRPCKCNTEQLCNLLKAYMLPICRQIQRGAHRTLSHTAFQDLYACRSQITGKSLVLSGSWARGLLLCIIKQKRSPLWYP